MRRISLVLGLCSPLSLALADAPSTDLEAISITSATRTERALEDSPVSVAVITEQQIQDIGAVKLRDVFTEIPGVFVNPGRGEMSIRGAGAKGTLLLIDGRRVSGETGMGFELDRIAASSIERIEVVKGPMSVLYGSDALGGIINIITKQPTKALEGSLDASVGANTHGDGARYQVNGDVRGTSGALGYSAWASVIKSEAYSEHEIANTRVPKGAQGGQVAASKSDLRLLPDGKNTCVAGTPKCQGTTTPISQRIADQYAVNTTYREPSELINLGAALKYALTDSFKLGMDLAYMNEQRDGRFIADTHPSNYLKPNGTERLPVFAVPVDQSWDNERFDMALRAEWLLSDIFRLNWRSYSSHYEKTESITTPYWQALGYASQQASSSLSGTGTVETLGHELSATWNPVKEHTLLMGVDYRDEDRSAPFFNTMGVVESRDYNFTSGFVQDEWRVTDELGLIAGVRYDDISTGESATSGNVGVQYAFNSAARLRASYAQGFRAADLPETFINRVTPQGRMLGASVADASVGKVAFDLKPETSDNFEVGLGGRGSNWDYDIAIFQNTISDRIERVAEAPIGIAYRTYRNISEARIQGLEAKGGYRIQPGLGLSASMSLLDAKNQQNGQRLEFTPEQTFNLSLDWRATSELKLKATAQHVGNQFYTDIRSGKPVPSTASAYTLFNLHASYVPSGFNDVEFYGGIDNLFDNKVETILGSNVGIYPYVGVRKFF
ncbi:MAG: TonB-dependent receptor plug domain-containing protein [Halothiobacillaceae bacterium]